MIFNAAVYPGSDFLSAFGDCLGAVLRSTNCAATTVYLFERTLMTVLVAFECSGIVRDTFIKLGHDAVSCDIKPAENAGPHMQCSVDDSLSNDWDLIIMHPPCTYLCVSGNAHYADSDKRKAAILETLAWYSLACDHAKYVALENPVGVLSSTWTTPDQIIQPYQFGHDASKKTCLWLRNLPKLTATDFIPVRSHDLFDDDSLNDVYDNQTASGQNKLPPGPNRAADRSRTYQGIADAMAKQWSKLL